MSILDIEPGTILRLRTFRDYPAPGDETKRFRIESLDYTANPPGTPKNKQRVFVVVLLGVELHDQPDISIDPDKALRALGYIEAPAKEEPPTADDPGEGERPGVVSGSSDSCSKSDSPVGGKAMKIFPFVFAAVTSAIIAGLPDSTVQEPADKISCDEHLAHAVKTCKDTGLSEFACKEGGEYSFKCKDMPNITLTVDREPARLTITTADGSEIGHRDYPKGKFRDEQITLRYMKR